MDELLDQLRDYRTGKAERGTVHARFVVAGFDPSDADALLNNLNYTPLGDAAQQFIDRQARRRQRQTNPLMSGR